MCSIDFIYLGVSESKMPAEVGNKALIQHNLDVLDPKVLVTKIDFVF